jgi:CSLREA domain-containing protein
VHGLRMLKAGLLAVGLLLIGAAGASAATITVTSTGDATADDGQCTLREAITAANTNTASTDSTGSKCLAGDATPDTIDFSAAFNGELADTITLGSALPPITSDLTIDGGRGGTPAQPLTGLDEGGFNGLEVDSGTVTIKNLAITHGIAAILIQAPSATVSGNWFGVKLDGTTEDAVTNGVAIFGDAADGNTIGGTTAAERNVFARTTGTAVDMEFGPDSNVVTGNYFGTRPDGSVAGPGKVDGGITIAGTTTGPNQATGNTIGGAETLGTPSVCDGACNLIDNAFNDGVDLDTQGGSELPAQNTTVAGNFIGLGVDGTSDQGNGVAGVNVGGSINTTVGGAPNLGDLRNFIDGNDDIGVDIGSGTGVKVQNNYIGAPAAGTTPVPNDFQADGPGQTLRGVFTRSGNSGAIIVNNRLLENPVVLSGGTAQFRANTILGADGSFNTALDIFGSSNQIGVGGMTPQPQQANTIGDVTGTALPAIEVHQGANNNLIRGNSIGVDPANGDPLPIGGTAIRIGALAGLSGPGVTTGTVVGANSTDMPFFENVISNAGNDAISLVTNGSNNNHILRNTGRNNGSPSVPQNQFIDLSATGAGADDGLGNDMTLGPDGHIQAPVVTSATTTTISGTSPEIAGTPIYAFSTSSSKGDVRAYLGTATVAASMWTVTYSSPQGNGVCVTALQDATAKGSSELAAPTPIGAASCDVDAPETTITSGPANGETIKTDTATFEFDATDANTPSTFECKLDDGPFTGCLSPKANVQLGDGTHTFQVRATDPAGNVDATPDTRTFTVDTSTPPSGGSTDTTPPQTMIGKVKVKGTTATATFSGSDSGSRFARASASATGLSFKCKLDKGKFKACRSPKKFKHLKAGKHKVTIEAIDAAGNVDPTPAKKKFRV